MGNFDKKPILCKETSLNSMDYIRTRQIKITLSVLFFLIASLICKDNSLGK